MAKKYDINTEKVKGAEALIRWNHPEKGMLSPGSFIPACETNGFVCTIDFFVLEEVCPLSARMIVNQVSMKMESERIQKLLSSIKKVLKEENK